MKKNESPPSDENSIPSGKFILRLYVAGSTPLSARAIVNVRKLCDLYLKNRYKLDVVDISRDPVLAEDAQIIATPTLVKARPEPLRRFVGDMTQTQRFLTELGVTKLD